MIGLFRLFAHLWRTDRRLIGEFWRTGRECYKANPNALPGVITLMAFYLHLGPFAASVVKSVKKQIAAIDAAEWQRPPLATKPPAPLIRTPMQAAE